MFRLVVSLFLALNLSGCQTGIPTVDDLTSPRKTCGLDVNLQNSSSNALVLNVWGTESGMDAKCKDYATPESEKTVSPGDAGTVHVELQCRTCFVHPVVSVYPAGQKAAPVYQGSEKKSVICTDTACTDN